MAITIFGGDLRTGLIRVRNIPAVSGSVRTILGEAGTINCTLPVPMRIPGTKAVVDIWNLLQPAKSFIGWEENGVILNAGPLWTSSYNLDNKHVSLGAAGLRSYWQFRYVLPLLAAGELPPGHDTSYSGLSLRTIAKRLIQQAQTWTAGSVPLVYEGDIANTNVRTYEGHELHVVDEKLKQISEVDGGPDIMFLPEYTNVNRTHVRWRMTTGSPEIKQPGSPHKWDASGMPNPPVRNASVSRDGTVIVTDNYQIGATPDEEDAYPLFGRATSTTLTNQGFPRMESSEDRSSVTDTDTLGKHASEAVKVGRTYMETWKFEAKKSVVPKIGDYAVGDYCNLAVKDDPIYGTGEIPLRVVEIASKLGSGHAEIAAAPKRAGV